MVRIDAALAAAGHQSAMLLQVRDELVFECPPDELDAVSRMVKQEMEGVCQLTVPLVVDIGTGDNWRDAK
jgi:DNA polymerase-1